MTNLAVRATSLGYTGVVGRAGRTLLSITRRLLRGTFVLPITPATARALRDGLFLAGLLVAVYDWWMLAGGGLPYDAHSYWSANPHALYPADARYLGNGYVYSPAFEFLVAPLRLLDFPTFVAVWRAIMLAALAYLTGPFLVLVLFWLPVQSELNAGNVQILVALAVVLGFRWPATWAFILLTKLTPGLGLVWFAVRREWRQLSVALVATAAVALLSFVLMPAAWVGWWELLTRNRQPSVAPYFMPFWFRAPFAVAGALFAGLTGRRWILVLAAALALPVYYVISASLLVGVFPYVRAAAGRGVASWLRARDAWLAETASRVRRTAEA